VNKLSVGFTERKKRKMGVNPILWK